MLAAALLTQRAAIVRVHAMRDPALPKLVEHLFRHAYGRLVAGLVRAIGADKLDLAEDVVQEALLRALRTWPATGVPAQPDAWVHRVAKNLALDTLRHRAIAARELPAVAEWADAELPADHRIVDDTLRMMFTCCHPAVPEETRVPLVLKAVGGFGVAEIAAALLQKEATVAQRLSRGKARLQALDARFELPAPDELPSRLPLVLEVLYLMFNEGYRAHRGSDLVRQDLVEEAVRLGALLLDEPRTALPEVHALLALLLLLGARLPARTTESGDLLPLADQDRSRWDRSWLGCGFAHLRRSIGGDRITAYHCEAAIASIHAAAPDYAATDWRAIRREYDRLLRLCDTPIVRLNHSIAVAKTDGPAAALPLLHELAAARALADYFLLPATIGYLHWQLGEHAAAAAAFDRALQLPSTEPEQRLLVRRRDAAARGEPAPAW